MRLPFFAAAAVYIAAGVYADITDDAKDAAADAASSISSVVSSATVSVPKPTFTVRCLAPGFLCTVC
jgi:hypothetical protein